VGWIHLSYLQPHINYLAEVNVRQQAKATPGATPTKVGITALKRLEKLPMVMHAQQPVNLKDPSTIGAELLLGNQNTAALNNLATLETIRVM